jgi:hypothetical protein
MSFRPARSCWRRGRSVSGTAAVGLVREGVGAVRVDVAAAEDVAAVDALVWADFTAEVMAPGVDVGFAPAAALGFAGVGVVTGRGWDMGVSYRI